MDLARAGHTRARSMQANAHRVQVRYDPFAMLVAIRQFGNC